MDSIRYEPMTFQTFDRILPGPLPAYLGGPDPFAFTRPRPQDRFKNQGRGARGATKRPIIRGYRGR